MLLTSFFKGEVKTEVFADAESIGTESLAIARSYVFARMSHNLIVANERETILLHFRFFTSTTKPLLMVIVEPSVLWKHMKSSSS